MQRLSKDADALILLEMFENEEHAGNALDEHLKLSRQRLEAAGAKVFYESSALLGQPDGGVWDHFRLSGWPSRADFQALRSRSSDEELPLFRGPISGVKRRMSYGFTPMRNTLKMDQSNPDEVYVLNLLRFKPGDGRQQYQQYGKVTTTLMQTSDVQSQGAVIVGHAAGEPELKFDSVEEWEDMYLVQYPSLEALLGMVSAAKRSSQ